jgi:hypothetical protein
MQPIPSACLSAVIFAPLLLSIVDHFADLRTNR